MEGFWEQFKEYILIPFDKQLLSIAPEIGHLAPVILTIGTAFVSLVTLNYPLFMFAASSVEAHLLYNIAKLVSDYFVTPILGISHPRDGEKEASCRSFFQTMNPSRFNWFMEQGIKTTFPNQPLYWLSFAAAYLIQSMKFFSEEASELGPQYSNRPYLAILGASMFIALYAVYLMMYGCDGIFTILISIAIGVVVGLLISSQNALLFGKPSVNVLFVPPLMKRAGMDYICVSSSPSP
jgi:hypothetical protein